MNILKKINSKHFLMSLLYIYKSMQSYLMRKKSLFYRLFLKVRKQIPLLLIIHLKKKQKQ